MGSSGGKPRKPQHHLPKVGTPANKEYEREARRKEVFGNWPMVLIAAVIVIVLLAWLVIT